MFPTLPSLAKCQAGEQQLMLLRQQPETYSAWESAGVNAPDLSHAKIMLLI